MWDFFKCMKEHRLYDSARLNAVVNRLNMGRLYTFSLIGCAGMLVFAVLLHLFVYIYCLRATRPLHLSQPL